MKHNERKNSKKEYFENSYCLRERSEGISLTLSPYRQISMAKIKRDRSTHQFQYPLNKYSFGKGFGHEGSRFHPILRVDDFPRRWFVVVPNVIYTVFPRERFERVVPLVRLACPRRISYDLIEELSVNSLSRHGILTVYGSIRGDPRLYSYNLEIYRYTYIIPNPISPWEQIRRLGGGGGGGGGGEESAKDVGIERSISRLYDIFHLKLLACLSAGETR